MNMYKIDEYMSIEYAAQYLGVELLAATFSASPAATFAGSWRR